MTASNIENEADEFSIPIGLNDIINICRQYNQLGWQMQQQIQNIIEVGMDQSIKSGYVKPESLPHIKSFLKAIIGNVYFGDACKQAEECLYLIDLFCENNKNLTLN